MAWGGARWAVVGVVAVASAFVISGVAALAALPPLDNPYLDDQFLGGLSAVSVGAFVAWRKPGHPLGWLLLVAGTTMWDSFCGSPVIAWMMVHTPSLESAARVLLAVSISGWIAARGIFLVFVPMCYPTPRQSGIVRRLQTAVGALAIGSTCLAHARVFTADFFAGVPPTGSARLAQRFEPWGHRAIFVVGIGSIVDMLVRVARLPRNEVRRHAPVAAVGAVLLLPSLNSVYGNFTGQGFFGQADQIELWAMIALPVVLAVGIVRHGLLDISVVVRRSTVYGLSAVVLAGVYVVAVWLSSVVVASEGTGVGRVVATGVVAIAVLPVHVRINRLVDQRLFGRRYDPAAVLAALGTTVERSPQGAQALELVAATVADELRLPFVAIDLDVHGSKVRVAQIGNPCDAVEVFSLTTAEGVLGDFTVARRTAKESFDTRELSALAAIARQVAVVAANVLLTEELKASRRSLVEAREEERRRIRRDLHDGLGPTLASVCLGLGAAAEQIGEASDLGALLRDLESELRDGVDDIRRLVHELRPPALDEFGLVRAVRDHADAMTARTTGAGHRVHVSVDGPATAASLPAAVEVAAYRIALEAITNMSRHSAALHCWVRIRAEADAVEVEIEDDGRGFDGSARAGVGLRSMRDRAAELGGLLEVTERLPRGTLVRARLPLGAVLA